jgi:hypothetical protein
MCAGARGAPAWVWRPCPALATRVRAGPPPHAAAHGCVPRPRSPPGTAASQVGAAGADLVAACRLLPRPSGQAWRSRRLALRRRRLGPAAAPLLRRAAGTARALPCLQALLGPQHRASAEPAGPLAVAVPPSCCRRALAGWRTGAARRARPLLPPWPPDPWALRRRPRDERRPAGRVPWGERAKRPDPRRRLPQHVNSRNKLNPLSYGQLCRWRARSQEASLFLRCGVACQLFCRPCKLAEPTNNCEVAACCGSRTRGGATKRLMSDDPCRRGSISDTLRWRQDMVWPLLSPAPRKHRCCFTRWRPARAATTGGDGAGQGPRAEAYATPVGGVARGPDALSAVDPAWPRGAPSREPSHRGGYIIDAVLGAGSRLWGGEGGVACARSGPSCPASRPAQAAAGGGRPQRRGASRVTGAKGGPRAKRAPRQHRAARRQAAAVGVRAPPCTRSARGASCSAHCLRARERAPHSGRRFKQQ